MQKNIFLAAAAVAALFLSPAQADVFGSACTKIKDDHARLECFDRSADARVSAARDDLENLMTAIKLYRLDNGVYPTTEQGLQALIKRPAIRPAPKNWKPYVETLPFDPWGRPYQYQNPGMHGQIDVFSLGPPNTNAAIGSWK